MKLAERPNRNNQVQKVSRQKSVYDYSQYRRPFWLPAGNYYVLAIAIAVAFFFLLLGIFYEGKKDDDSPWIVAATGAIFFVSGAVILREVILRKARNRYLLAQQQLDYTLNNVAFRAQANRNPNKLTLEKNAAILKEIRIKSDAAKVLGKLPEGHFEVFEMCNEYLQINQHELETVGVGSPRLPALLRGKELVQDLHHFHLLNWAQIESRSLTQEAKNRVTISEKLETAQKALTVLDSALRFYPNETQLIESGDVLKEFIASIKISHWIEQAERSAFKGNYKRAISHYRDALFFLAREDVREDDKQIIADKINLEIEKLREILEKKGNNQIEK